MPRDFKAYNGKTYPVSDAHAALIDAGYGKEWPNMETAEIQRHSLLEMSNDRELTKKERAMLEAATHIKNLHSCVKFLGDRHHDDIFGPGSTLCQVHGQQAHLSCGCILHEIFDHHTRETGVKEVHAHTPRRSCDSHAHLLHDFKAHHAKAKADHEAKHAAETPKE